MAQCCSVPFALAETKVAIKDVPTFNHTQSYQLSLLSIIYQSKTQSLKKQAEMSISLPNGMSQNKNASKVCLTKKPGYILKQSGWW